MTTTATIGYGTVIRIGVGAGPTWTTLTGVRDVEWPMAEADEHEVTDMASPDRTKEYVAGLIDNGEVTIPLWWTPKNATDTVLAAIHATGELVQIEFTANQAGATPETFAGFCKKYSRTSPVNGPQEAEAAFRINGRV